MKARGATPARTSVVMLGAAASGLGIYVFQVIAARALDGERYAPVAVLWTLQYLAFAVLLHPGEALVAQEGTRHGPDSPAARRAAAVVVLWSLALAVAVGAGALLLADAALGSDRWLAPVAVAIVAVYGGFVVVRGLLVAQGRALAYAWATVVDAAGRVLLALLVVLVGASTRALAWTLPAGAAAVVVWGLLAARRRLILPPAVEGFAPWRLLGSAAAAALAAQTLLAGAPLVLAASGARATDVSVAFATFALARAPLVLGFNGLLTQAVPYVLRLRTEAGDGPARALRRAAGATGGLAVLAAGAAWLIGPSVIELVFGPAFGISGAVVALVVAGSVLASVGLLLTQAAVVLETGRSTLPWVAGLAVAAVVFSAPTGDDLRRVAAAFACGELVAVTGLFGLLRGWARCSA